MLVTKDFVLVHVPKTGGTFLRNAIEKTCETIPLDLPFHSRYDFLPADYRHLPAMGFVRNPWEWYVSWYEMHQLRPPESPAEVANWGYEELRSGDFGRYIRAAFARRWDFYSFELHRSYLLPGVEVGKFERLRTDFIGFLDRHGVGNGALRERVMCDPPVNESSYRHSMLDYYDDELRALVGSSWVAQEFGYRACGSSVRSPASSRARSAS